VASHFGEILPFESRAVDEDDEYEEDDIPDDQQIEVYFSCGNQICKSPLEVPTQTTIIVSVGPVACAFAETYLFTSETKHEQTLFKEYISNLPLMYGNVGKEDVKTKAELCTVYSRSGIILCSFKKEIEADLCFEVTQQIFSNVTKESRVIILTGDHISRFYSHFRENPPFLRCLSSLSFNEKTACPYLEQPNIISGISAATLTHCEVKRIPCILYVAFMDILDVDSVNVEIYLPLLRCHNIGTSFQISESGRKSIRQLATKTQNQSNLYL